MASARAGSAQLGQRLSQVDHRRRPFGETSEIGKIPREVLSRAVSHPQNLEGLLLFQLRGLPQLPDGEPHRGERILHLVGNSPGDFPERPEPFRVELGVPGLLQGSGGFTKGGAEGREFRRAAPVGLLRRKGFIAPDARGPAEQLVDRFAELAGQAPHDDHSGIQQEEAQGRDRGASPTVLYRL